jgi:nickel/cobalt transporter (NicO) family protein
VTDLGRFELQLLALFDAPGAAFVAVLLAAAAGAFHAVAPGHGKAITAAYLVSGEARRRDAALLGGAVAVMHTASVAVLAIVWVTVSATSTFSTDHVTAWLQVAAAGMVVAVGLALVHRRWQGGTHEHTHGHGGTLGHAHGHVHGHSHGQASAHTHGRGVATVSAPPERLDRRLLVALAVSGGLLPSPSAFLVLITGLLSGRAVFAVVLGSAFALGMAATLTLVGIATLSGRDLLARSGSGGRVAVLHRWIPTLGAAGVLVGGVLYLGVAVRALIN